MKAKDFRRSGIVFGAIAVVLGCLPAVASADIISDYHPVTEARTFSTSPGGWSASTTSSGLCVDAVNCPAVSNTWQARGGAGGEGFIRTGISSLTSAGGEVTGVWQSPSFTYNGAVGTVPDSLTFFMDRRASVNALLTAAAGDAQYTIDIEDLNT